MGSVFKQELAEAGIEGLAEAWTEGLAEDFVDAVTSLPRTLPRSWAFLTRTPCA